LYLNLKKRDEIGKTESRDDLYNVASKAAHQQIYVAYVFFIYLYFKFLLRPCTSKQRYQ